MRFDACALVFTGWLTPRCRVVTLAPRARETHYARRADSRPGGAIFFWHRDRTVTGEVEALALWLGPRVGPAIRVQPAIAGPGQLDYRLLQV